MMLGFKMFNYSETVWIAITVSIDNAPSHELIPCFKILFNRGRLHIDSEIVLGCLFLRQEGGIVYFCITKP